MQISRYSLKIPSFTEADILKYSVYPISDEALQFHKLANPAQPNISLNQIDVNLVNIRGLITHKENKSAFLKSATLAQDNSLTFITETHLFLKRIVTSLPQIQITNNYPPVVGA